MRRLASLALLGVMLLGCEAAATAEDAGGADACDPALGVLEVCIYGSATSTTPYGGTATARRDATDVPWIMRSGADGCTRELVEVGTWEVSASDPSGTCVTPFEPVEIRSCETTTVRAEVDTWCVDG